MKNILCFVYDTFVNFESALVCHYITQNENFNVIYVGYDDSPVKSLGGMKVTPDTTFSKISSTLDISGIIIPGGVDRIVRPELKSLILKLMDQKKLVAAICAGPEYLARLGILDNKKYTCSMEPEEYKEKNEEDPFPRKNYVEARVVRDDNVITAKGSAFIDFALEIWDFLELYDYETEKEECKALFSAV
ncbi:MAG: DJ-1/PfpI family protein [Candidatus Hodarchaeota archaeon]